MVVIHQQGRPQFVRTIGSGGNATTAAIAAGLDLPLADAEALKRRIGEPTPQVQSAERAAQPSLTNWREIRNSIQYFASLPGRLPVSGCWSPAVAPTFTAWIPLLEAQVRLPVQPASPLARLDVSKVEMTQEQMSQVGAVLSTPIGLALPESNQDAKKFNLLPPEAIKQAKLKKVQERTLIGAVALIVLLGGLGVWRYFQVQGAQNNVNSLNASIATLNAEIPKYDLVVKANNAFKRARPAGLGAGLLVDWPPPWPT